MKVKNKFRLLCLALLLLVSSSYAQTQQMKGLVVMVEFVGNPFPEPADSVEMMMNQTGFSQWGCQGSVKDYFYAQSDGKIEITHTVVKVSIPNPISHYTSGAGRDLSDIIDAINAAYPAGFTDLTLRPDNSLLSFTVLTKINGMTSNAFGPQPGSNTIKNNGVNAYVFRGNFTYLSTSEKPSHNTVCHEMGHSVFDWPDHYVTAWSNLGNYCAMGMGGNRLGPQMINPALRLKAGWINNVIEIGNKTYDTTITAVSNSYSTVYKYTNPSNPKEYLLVHPLKYGTYFQERISNHAVADQGLSIFYVDEDGGMDLAGQGHGWQIKLVSADNKNDLHDEKSNGSVSLGGGLYYNPISGDYGDLYDDIKNSFPAGTPFRWKDGGEFGLFLGDISAPGSTMTFTVYARSNTYIAKSDNNGTISPKGIINSTSKTFTFTPNPGYEINTVKINESNVTPVGNQYTLTGSGTKTIEVTYNKISPEVALPSPWLKDNIGFGSATGFAAHNSGSFYIESYGSSVSGTSDNLTFVHQTLTGDGAIVARIKEYKSPSKHYSKFGLMVREGLLANSAQAMISKIPYGGVKAEQRTGTGLYIGDDNAFGGWHLYELYTWLKLTRIGNTITSYVSADGSSWVKRGEQTLSLSSSVYIGLFATGELSGVPARVLFDSVSVFPVTPCPNGGVKLAGTAIGTPGSYNNSGYTHDKAFDNDIYTFFDSDAADDIAWTGLSLGGDYSIQGIKYYPREYATDRMVGGKFQGSNVADFSAGVVDLAVITTEPSLSWNCVDVTSSATFKYLRYISPAEGYGNVAEIEFFGSALCPSGVKLTGIAIGTPGSYNNGGDTHDKAFDGNVNTFFDSDAADDVAWTGLSLGGDNIVNGIKYYPREDATDRMAGGKFQGSNVADFSTGVVDLAVITAEPALSWNCVNVTSTAAYKYVRYISPAGGYGNVAEIEFYGTAVITNVSPTVSITSPTASASFTTPASVNITATASDSDGSISKVEFFVGATLVNTDYTAPYSYTWSTSGTGSYTITAKATDDDGASTSASVNISVTASAADINGPSCGSNYTTLTYEVAAVKRTNATSYNWWYTGSAQSVNAVSGTPYQANVMTGNDFQAGQLCVGINYSGAPYYASYCINLSVCSGLRGESAEFTESASEISYQNPFVNSTMITFPNPNQFANIQVMNASGLIVEEAQATGAYEFGSELKPGFYIVKINFENESKVVKLVKE